MRGVHKGDKLSDLNVISNAVRIPVLFFFADVRARTWFLAGIAVLFADRRHHMESLCFPVHLITLLVRVLQGRQRSSEMMNSAGIFCDSVQNFRSFALRLFQVEARRMRRGIYATSAPSGRLSPSNHLSCIEYMETCFDKRTTRSPVFGCSCGILTLIQHSVQPNEDG